MPGSVQPSDPTIVPDTLKASLGAFARFVRAWEHTLLAHADNLVLIGG